MTESSKALKQCEQPFVAPRYIAASQEDEPAWADEPMTDRELAARMCAGCPVQDECLELDLRVAGESTAGVWGALPEDDRRALYPHWLQRGERVEGGWAR